MTRTRLLSVLLLAAAPFAVNGKGLAFVPGQSPELSPPTAGAAALLADAFATAGVFVVPWRQAFYCYARAGAPGPVARKLGVQAVISVEVTEGGEGAEVHVVAQDTSGRAVCELELGGAGPLEAIAQALPALREALAKELALGAPRWPPTRSAEAFDAYARGVAEASQPASQRNAEALFREATVADPQFALAHRELGRALYEQGKLEAAIASYRSAMAARPDCGMGHVNLTAALVRTGDLAGAEAEAQAAIGSPDDPAAEAFGHVALGNVLRKNKDYPAARRAYDAARALAPKQPGPVLQLAVLSLYEKDAVAAEGLLRRVTTALDIDRRATADASRVLGELHLRQKRFNQAVVEYERAVDLRPEYALALIGLGSAYRSLNMLVQAEEAYRRVLELDTDPKALAKAHNNIGVIRRQQGKQEEALTHFRRALQLDPEDATIQENVRRAERGK